jgi:hypothetical protein
MSEPAHVVGDVGTNHPKDLVRKIGDDRFKRRQAGGMS